MFFTETELQNKVIGNPLQEFAKLRNLAKKRPIIVSYLNAHVLALLFVSKKFRKIFAQVDYFYPDGWGGVLYLRLLGCSADERSSAPDFFFKFLSKWKGKTKIFLLGGRIEAVSRVKKLLSAKFPAAHIVGQQGYFKNNRQVANKVLVEKPDILIIGMGADRFWQLPKQEQWAIEQIVPSKVPCLVWCVGDLFTQVFAERKSQSWYTEWWQRTQRNPQKMLARYVFDAICFVVVMFNTAIILVWKQFIQKIK